MLVTEDVLFEVLKGKYGNIGIITLNRPKALNALNHLMIRAMYQQLQLWLNDDALKAVVIRGAEGRAFCAGGDIRLTYDRYMNKDPELTGFFRDEYALNQLIFNYSKPYIAYLNGITMGGGVGVSIHGSHRIATENLIFAMPETGIGFYPDVGGTYFLPRLSGSIGYYLGLTGARIEAHDCFALGLATNFIDKLRWEEVLQTLRDIQRNDSSKAQVSTSLEPFQLVQSNETILSHQQAIDECFTASGVEDIISRAKVSNDPLCKEAAASLLKKSPTSLKVTLEAMYRTRDLDFDAAMQQEFILTSHFLEQHDFIEGIRAVIVDKDQNPKWKPPALSLVSAEAVEAYFSVENRNFKLEAG